LRSRPDRRLLLGAHFLYPLHRLRMARPLDLLLFRSTVQLGMNVEAARAARIDVMEALRAE